MTSASDICPHCGGVVGAVRAGVPMTALKARLFDVLRRAGSAGLSTADIHALVFADRGTGREAVKVHVAQLNDLLDVVDLVILSRPYRLVRR